MITKRTMRPRFKVKKFKWYLVDLSDFYNPILVRKHLDNELQAKKYRDKYYEDFEVAYWKDIKKYNIRDHEGIKKSHLNHTTKYEYPDRCDTQRKRCIYRNIQRKKARQIMRRPKVTETAIWEILDDKPVLFVKRVKHYSDNHWALSEPVEGLKLLRDRYPWPKDLRHLCNIVRVLKEYYDVGLYPIHKVAFFIWKKWGARIRRHCDKYPQSNPTDKGKVIKELIKRGFIPQDECNFGPTDSHISSVKIYPVLAHPEICWHSGKEMPLYDHNIFDFHVKMGIHGYTKCHQGGISRKKKREDL